MNISIDTGAGFCFGVTRAIQIAEEELNKGHLFVLGDIVHNGQEVKRLEAQGLETIDYDDLRTLHNVRVLLRAHGEPPSTYHIAHNNADTIIDATCPVVRKLQERIRDTYQTQRDAQIVIYGKNGHAEVIGLQGQTNNTAVIVESTDDINKIDFSRDIFLFSQTTMSVEGFQNIVETIQAKLSDSAVPRSFHYYNTICRNVANRVENLKTFAAAQDLVIFVGGRKSSNAKVLYQHCLEANPNTVFIEGPEEIRDLLSDSEAVQHPTAKRSNLQQQSAPISRIGITGATSTPLWLMQQVKDALEITI